MKKSISKSAPIATSDKVEEWLKCHARIIFYVLLAVTVLFSALYFNARVSIAGDDSTYITRAMSFWDSGSFPSYQGPLYPMVLSLIVGLFGMNLVMLKVSSAIFMVISIVLLYKAFKDRVSYIALFFTISAVSVSHYFLLFSSQTFSEAFFMFLQGAFFLYMFSNIEQEDGNKWILSKVEYKQIGAVVLFSALMFITRTVGFGAIVAAVVFYLINKQFKRAVYVLVGFGLLLTVLIGVKSVIWDLPAKSGEQTIQLLNKHPYDSSQGKEDFTGFIQRFKDNSNLYLSKHLMRIVGLKSTTKNTTDFFVTISLYVLFLLGFFWFFKRNKVLLFTAVYLAILLGITFFSLQKLWDQYRLIIPYVPFVMLFLVSTMVQIAREKNIIFLKRVIPFLLVVSLCMILGKGVATIDLQTLSKNLRGDKFAGFTPDWVSYLQMVDYVDNNLGKSDTYVACRKPNIASIYGKGRKFYGVYRIPEKSPDLLLEKFKEKGVTHVVLASLRKNPHVYTGQTINTIKRYMSVIVKKYPRAFKLVKQFGKKEPAFLYEIDYTGQDIVNKSIEIK